MTRLQFRVLYRQFLFRMVDLELLSAQGDISKLLGQFAALLIFVSVMLALGALTFDSREMAPDAFLIASWRIEHLLISTTMLVVGLFSVLSWDSMLPDRRDVFVLAPLPVPERTLFLAKAAAAATAMSLTVVSLHIAAGLTWPFALLSGDAAILAGIRSLAAYWITMFAAGAFIFCSVLFVQGLAAQLLSRRRFLRLSAFLQMAAFSLFVSVYFLQPAFATPKALTAPENQRLLAWLPAYWFLGLFQELNGSAHPALATLARRAWAGLAITGFGAAAAFLLSYLRTLRKIVEEPDIVPGARRLNWSPRFGSLLETTIVLFSMRTLLRSRQHRVILAFYSGIAFAILIFIMKTPGVQRQLAAEKTPLLFSSIVMMCFWLLGTRIAFSLPLDLRANWIFRISKVRGTAEYFAAIRRALLVLAVAPIWLISAALLVSIWPVWPVAGHLIILGLLAAILVEFSLHSFHKIPFTCSYLPGKSNVPFTTWLFGPMLLLLIARAVGFERRALEDPAQYAAILAILGITAVFARWRTTTIARSPDAALYFEEVPPPAVQTLDLSRDGVLPIMPLKS